MQGIQASYDEYTARVKSGKVQSYRGTDWCMVGGAVKTDVEKGIM